MRGDAININAQAAEAGLNAKSDYNRLKMHLKQVGVTATIRSKSAFN
jgi:hypothetical protein